MKFSYDQSKYLHDTIYEMMKTAVTRLDEYKQSLSVDPYAYAIVVALTPVRFIVMGTRALFAKITGKNPPEDMKKSLKDRAIDIQTGFDPVYERQLYQSETTRLVLGQLAMIMNKDQGYAPKMALAMAKHYEKNDPDMTQIGKMLIELQAINDKGKELYGDLTDDMRAIDLGWKKGIRAMTVEFEKRFGVRLAEDT